MKSYALLKPYFSRHKGRLVMGLGALLICDLLQLLIPRVTRHAVDLLSEFQATPTKLAWAGLAIVGMAVLIGLFRFVWRLLILGFSRIVERDLRRRLYDRVMALPPAWYMTRTTGDVMARATNDLEAIRFASGLGQVAAVDAVLMGAASIGFMVAIDPRLTLYAMIPMPIIPVLTRYLGRMMHRRYRVVQDAFGGLTQRVREYLSGVHVVKAHVSEDLALADLDRMGRNYVRQNVRLNLVTGAFFPLMMMMTNLSMAIVIYFGGRMTVFKSITPGDFVAFISYLALLTWPMMALGWVTNLIQRGAAALDRMNAVLGEPVEELYAPGKSAPAEKTGRIEIKNLSYTYPGRNRPVLENVSLTARPGRITALVGRTGSGKSTLLNMIPHLLEPPAGAVFVDGQAVEDWPLAELRSAIGYVPQDGYIFSGTIRDNLTFGRPDADQASIERAAAAAEFWDDVLSFPDGLETTIGERGVTLSGGQKQRLALARALLIDAPILILDDTLSAVDAGTEAKIVANIGQFRSNRTILLASHRLTSLRIADVIWVLEDGRITQSGRHEELAAQGGYYANLYHLQTIEADLSASSEAPSAPTADR